MSTRPAYRDLAGGRGIAVYGEGDKFGCLNLLTPERAHAAASLIRSGRTYSLNAPINYPDPYPAGSKSTRGAPKHVVLKRPYGRDDYLDNLYPQATSQWDHFLHVYDPDNNCFYDGTNDEAVGIDAWAERGITGRGVLLDVARWREAQGRPINWRLRDTVSVSDLERCAEAQRVSIEEGTILVLRFGWEAGFTAASAEERTDLTESDLIIPGLEASKEMVERLWDWGVAALGADNLAVEAYPPVDGYFMHVDLLARIGLPLGELWHVDGLADACAAEQRYEFFFASAPLNVPGGIGSTSNALAVL